MRILLEVYEVRIDVSETFGRVYVETATWTRDLSQGAVLYILYVVTYTWKLLWVKTFANCAEVGSSIYCIRVQPGNFRG